MLTVSSVRGRVWDEAVAAAGAAAAGEGVEPKHGKNRRRQSRRRNVKPIALQVGTNSVTRLLLGLDRRGHTQQKGPWKIDGILQVETAIVDQRQQMGLAHGLMMPTHDAKRITT